MCSRDHRAHTLGKEILRAFEVLALQDARSLLPLMLTPKGSPVTLSAEDGAMESRTHGPLHTGPVFSRSANTSWPYSQAGLVEEVPSLCNLVPAGS